MNIDFEELTKKITRCFPELKVCVAYGSAIFPQVSSQPTQIDLLFVVDSPLLFHQKNLKMNPSHYWIKNRFISNYFSFLQLHLQPLHYFPYIQLDQFCIKYGVISEIEFTKDMLTWSNFLIAGRLQKPVKVLIDNFGQLPRILLQNRKSALAVALLIQENILDKEQLYQDIVGLSYVGDIRFLIKAENSNKIQNIVKGQFNYLDEIYQPILKEFDPILRNHQEGQIFLIQEQRHRQYVIQQTVYNFQKAMGGPYFVKMNQIPIKEQNQLMIDYISKLNKINSKRLAFHSMIVGSPINNISYLLEKIKKGRRL